MDRKEYWNKSYADYWQKRVAETSQAEDKSQVVSGDAKTESDLIYENVFKKNNLNKGNVLDVGCAWGRMFNIFLKYNLEVFGVDISDYMIKECIKNWQSKFSIKNFQCAEAEKIPFEDNSFDNLVCIATFDATHQDKAISEFFRVLKTGGRLFLTGKNFNYLTDDNLALDAEIGARKKHHPNYFTDTKDMLQQIKNGGHKLVNTYFFVKRGDFAKLRYKARIPEKFYEYFLIIEKSTKHKSFSKFSYKFSRTFNEVNKINNNE